jgi:RimJ/RimL family protein N-acetyltransferase
MIGDKNFWGQGLGTEVYQLLLKYAFEDLKLRRLLSGCNVNNHGMIKILENLGYTREGVLRQADWVQSQYSDHLLYGLLRSEYFSDNKS